MVREWFDKGVNLGNGNGMQVSCALNLAEGSLFVFRKLNQSFRK